MKTLHTNNERSVFLVRRSYSGCYTSDFIWRHHCNIGNGYFPLFIDETNCPSKSFQNDIITKKLYGNNEFVFVERFLKE